MVSAVEPSEAAVNPVRSNGPRSLRGPTTRGPFDELRVNGGMLVVVLLLLVPRLALAQADGGTQAPNAALMPFSRESIVEVIDSHKKDISGCYEEFLAELKKPVEGTVKTSFDITPEGKVRHAKVEKKGTTLRDPKLHQCILGVVAAMDFPRPPDNRNHPIEYPFHLKAIR
jgi:hypothetical protein